MLAGMVTFDNESIMREKRFNSMNFQSKAALRNYIKKIVKEFTGW